MAVGDAHVFPGFLTPVFTQISSQSHQQLFSHASAEVRGENTLWQKQAISIKMFKFKGKQFLNQEELTLQNCLSQTFNVWSMYVQSVNIIEAKL